MSDVTFLYPGPEPVSRHEGCPLIVFRERETQHRAIVNQDGQIVAEQEALLLADLAGEEIASFDTVTCRCVLHECEVDTEGLTWDS